MPDRAPKRHRSLKEVDRLTLSLLIDKAAQVLLFISGISAILFILSIIVFVFEQGLGFLLHDVDIVEFLTSPYWEPTDDDDPVYGILALVAGTASVTGLAMLVAIPFSLGAAIFIAEFATGKTRETLKILVELLAAIRRCRSAARSCWTASTS